MIFQVLISHKSEMVHTALTQGGEVEKTPGTTFTIWPTDHHPKMGNKTLGSILYLLAKPFNSFLLFSCKMRHQYLPLSTPKRQWANVLIHSTSHQNQVCGRGPVLGARAQPLTCLPEREKHSTLAQTTATPDSYFWGRRGLVKVKLGCHGIFSLGEMTHGCGGNSLAQAAGTGSPMHKTFDWGLFKFPFLPPPPFPCI